MLHLQLLVEIQCFMMLVQAKILNSIQKANFQPSFIVFQERQPRYQHQTRQTLVEIQHSALLVEIRYLSLLEQIQYSQLIIKILYLRLLVEIPYLAWPVEILFLPQEQILHFAYQAKFQPSSVVFQVLYPLSEVQIQLKLQEIQHLVQLVQKTYLDWHWA